MSIVKTRQTNQWHHLSAISAANKAWWGEGAILVGVGAVHLPRWMQTSPMATCRFVWF